MSYRFRRQIRKSNIGLVVFFLLIQAFSSVAAQSNTGDYAFKNDCFESTGKSKGILLKFTGAISPDGCEPDPKNHPPTFGKVLYEKGKGEIVIRCVASNTETFDNRPNCYSTRWVEIPEKTSGGSYLLTVCGGSIELKFERKKNGKVITFAHGGGESGQCGWKQTR